MASNHQATMSVPIIVRSGCIPFDILDYRRSGSSHCSKPAVGYVRRNIGYHHSSSAFELDGDPIGSWHALPAAPQLSLLRRPLYTRPGFLPDRGAFTTPNGAFRSCVHARAYGERARDDILLACMLRPAELSFHATRKKMKSFENYVVQNPFLKIPWSHWNF